MQERYQRQIVIERIGEKGQKKLADSSVAIIGTGGLGSPILTYLTLAGVGKLSMIDNDKVSLSNLNRQFLHGTKDIDTPKVTSAKEKLNALNPETQIQTHETRLTKENAEELLAGHDVVVGALDSMETRFIVNQTCVNLKIPYIDGGVKEFGGYVIFTNSPKTSCFNCIFPPKKAPPFPAGVLGTTACTIGGLEANITLLYLLGLPNPLENKLLVYDGLRLSMDLVDIEKDEKCGVCGFEK